LQSRTKGTTAPIRVIDEIQEQKHKCAELMYDEVSFVTLFYWRHKILAALKQKMRQSVVIFPTPTYIARIPGKRSVPMQMKRDWRITVSNPMENSVAGVMKRWMDRFNGVATKYLEHYLAWFRYLESKVTERIGEIENDHS
jgi:hypothetical protein